MREWPKSTFISRIDIPQLRGELINAVSIDRRRDSQSAILWPLCFGMVFYSWGILKKRKRWIAIIIWNFSLDGKRKLLLKNSSKWRRKKVFFQQQYEPCQISMAPMAKLFALEFELLLHRPYYSNLTLSEYYLFENPKRILQRGYVGWDNKIKKGKGNAFKELDKMFYIKKASKC